MQDDKIQISQRNHNLSHSLNGLPFAVKVFAISMIHKNINRSISRHLKFQIGGPFLGYKE